MNEVLKKQRIDIVVITETKKKLKGTKELNDYTMVYSGVPQCRHACSGVAVLANNKWKNKITSYTYVNERIITTRFKIDRGHLNIIAVYELEGGKKEDTVKLYDDLQNTLNTCNKSEHVLICGDLNARVGNLPISGAVSYTHLDVYKRQGILYGKR